MSYYPKQSTLKLLSTVKLRFGLCAWIHTPLSLLLQMLAMDRLIKWCLKALKGHCVIIWGSLDSVISNCALNATLQASEKLRWPDAACSTHCPTHPSLKCNPQQWLDINSRLAGRAFHLPGQAHTLACKASAQNELQNRKPAVHKGVLSRAGRTERFNILPSTVASLQVVVLHYISVLWTPGSNLRGNKS